MKPPAEGREHADFGGEQGDAEQQDGHVAEEDDDRGEQIALLGDVRLLGFEDMPGERDVESVGGAEQQVEPDQVRLPVPDQMADEEETNDDGGVNREEIRREGDEEIGFGDDDMAAVGGSLEFFHFAAEEPGPEHVGEFVADDVNPHRFGEQRVNDHPARRAGEQADPDGGGVAAVAQNAPERLDRADAERQEQDGEDELAPFGHEGRVGNPVYRF